MERQVRSTPDQTQGDSGWPVGLAILLGLPLAVFVLVLAAVKPIVIVLIPVALISVGLFVVLLLRGDLPSWTRKPPRWW